MDQAMREAIRAEMLARLPQVDDRDRAMIAERQAAFLDRADGEPPRQGDAIVFRDGTYRRVTYVWPDGVQSGSTHGSYYLGNGYMSYSGSLNGSAPIGAFTRLAGTVRAQAWAFHHDWRQAHNGVDFYVDVPVWYADVDAPR